MPELHTKADALRIFRTGAASYLAPPVARPDTSLGKYPSSFEEHALGFKVHDLIHGLRIRYVSGQCGPGLAYVRAFDNDWLQFKAPESDWGPMQRIEPGESKILLDKFDGSKFVRVHRLADIPLIGITTLVCTDEVNNVFGQDNVASSEASGGHIQHRCVAAISGPQFNLRNVKFWLEPLGTPVVVADYYDAGEATITIQGGFTDWPEFCYVENQNTGEVFYPADRTETTLTVQALHRDIYNETTGGSGVGVLGDVGDVLYPIPALRIGLEQPSQQPNGYFTDRTSDDTVPPAGVIFKHPIDGDDLEVLIVPKLDRGNSVGLWMQRHTVAGAKATVYGMNRIRRSFVID